tara:strand:+ start:941 stop:1186 length:246 start_codon:yes stop_codon:yes gene_type:complete
MATPNDVVDYFLDSENYGDLTYDEMKRDFENAYGPLLGDAEKTFEQYAQQKSFELGKKIDFAEVTQKASVPEAPQPYMIPD